MCLFLFLPLTLSVLALLHFVIFASFIILSFGFTYTFFAALICCYLLYDLSYFLLCFLGFYAVFLATFFLAFFSDLASILKLFSLSFSLSSCLSLFTLCLSLPLFLPIYTLLPPSHLCFSLEFQCRHFLLVFCSSCATYSTFPLEAFKICSQ